METAKRNFIKAFKELSGFDDEKIQDAASPSAFEPDTNKKVEKQSPEVANTWIAPSPFRGAGGSLTKITETMVVTGDIVSSSPLEIRGRVTGAVKCTNRIDVRGIIEGDLSGGTVVLEQNFQTVQSGKAGPERPLVRGNIKASGNSAVERGCTVLGNIEAESVKINGSVKGDVTGRNMVELGPEAVLLGDIKTSAISILPGTKIKGAVIMEGNEPGDMYEMIFNKEA